ncbi:MAG: M48 family metalloprotease [Egibacteraceae bacterium]
MAGGGRQGRSGNARPGRLGEFRRGADASALAGLLPALLLLPAGVVCFLPFAGLIAAVGGVPVEMVVVLWIAAAGLMFAPPVERLMLRRLCGARQPTPYERQVLEPCWQAVLARARIPTDRNRYILAVEDSGEINASATGGHLVIATTRAIDALSENELRAVLAHELGHHLGLHAVGLLLSYWLSAPVVWCSRLSSRMSKAASWLTGSLARVGIPGASLIGFVISLAFRLVAWCLRVLTSTARALGALSGRRSEYHADRTAIDLGFGPDLASALRRLHDQAPDRHRPATVGQRLFRTHPPVTKRIARIHERLSRGADQLDSPPPEGGTPRMTA